MGFLNRDSLEAILRPLKNKLDNCLTTSEANKIADSKLSTTGGNIDGTLTINNEAVISSNINYIRTTLGDNKLDFTKNGELKINDVNVKSSFVNIKFDNLASATEGTYIQNTNIPDKFGNGAAVSIGTYIYILGGNYSDNDFGEINYKYDTTNDTYIKNSNIPYKFYCGEAVSVGSDIYLLGGCDNPDISNYNYKYDTTTDTYSQNTIIPYKFNYGSAVSIGTDIYLFGSAYLISPVYPYVKYNYKYDTTTDTYSKNKDIPYPFNSGSAVAIGKIIYLLGGKGSNCNYKYDIITDTYTKNRDIPYYFENGSAVAIGTDIYLFGSGYYPDNSLNYLYGCNNYKYDTTTNTYSENKDIPYIFRLASAVINNNIYLLGGVGSIDTITSNCSYILSHESLIKPSNYSIYKINDSYESKNAEIIPIYDNDYYTEYDVDNNIVKSTYPIADEGITKMYIKSGAILNGKEVPCETEGWQDINLLEYM